MISYMQKIGDAAKRKAREHIGLLAGVTIEAHNLKQTIGSIFYKQELAGFEPNRVNEDGSRIPIYKSVPRF